MSGDHPSYYIIGIGQNTEKSPRELNRFAVPQTSLKDHQLTLMWKTLKEIILIICSYTDLDFNIDFYILWSIGSLDANAWILIRTKAYQR